MPRVEVIAPAVVLRTVDYGDRDRVVTLLVSGRGRRTAMAKGARASRKRFAGALEPLRVIEANYIDKSADRLAVLTGAHVHEVFPLMDASLDKISIASYATELAREIARDNQPDDTLFALLVDHYRAVNALDDEPAALEFAVQCFVIRALAAAGVLPPMGACARCHTTADRGQSWRLVWNAGAICSDCRRPGDIAAATQRHALLHLDAIARGAPGHGREAQRACRPLLLGLVRTLVGRDLKSTPFLHMVLS